MPSHAFRLVPFETIETPSGTFAQAPDIDITGTIALEAGTLKVIYQISGAAERVKYAAVSALPSRKNELWRTTCFELFLMLPAGPEYWEVNLAPGGDWNVYRFTGYRSELQPELRIADINIATGITRSGLTSVQAIIPLPPPLADRTLAVGVSSVIEDCGGNMHYFALRHGGVKPDFHDPTGFILHLDPASA